MFRADFIRFLWGRHRVETYCKRTQKDGRDLVLGQGR